MSTEALERFLAKIYVDPEARARFLADPRSEAAHAGLTEQQCLSLERIDKIGLQMAAQSFVRKRDAKKARNRLSRT